MTVKIWKSSVIAGHLTRTTQNDGSEDEEDIRLEGNAFAERGEAPLSGMMDEEHRGFEDDFDEEEGGGLALDENRRRKLEEKIEVGIAGLMFGGVSSVLIRLSLPVRKPVMTFQGKNGFK